MGDQSLDVHIQTFGHGVVTPKDTTNSWAKSDAASTSASATTDRSRNCGTIAECYRQAIFASTTMSLTRRTVSPPDNPHSGPGSPARNGPSRALHIRGGACIEEALVACHIRVTGSAGRSRTRQSSRRPGGRVVPAQRHCLAPGCTARHGLLELKPPFHSRGVRVQIPPRAHQCDET